MNLDAQDKQEVLSMAASSVEYFGKLFMPKIFFANTPDFHREIYGDLENENLARVGFIAPRGHSKSTLTSVLFPLWKTLFNPAGRDLLIIIISEAQSQSISFLNIIKHNLASNPRVLHYFGNLTGGKWSEDELVTSNGVRIIAKGTGQKVRGAISGRDSITRPNIIILDDFESETNSLTPEAIDKNKRWITRAVEPSIADDGRIIAIGTIINERAYLSTIRKDEAWSVRFYQAIMNGRPLWPERFSMDRLNKIKASCEARGEGASFWQEYMNTPIDMDTQCFREDYFQEFDYEFRLVDGIQPTLFNGEEEIPIHVTVGTDLAISTSHIADFTVILALGQAEDGRKFILGYERFKEQDTVNIIDKMFDVCFRYGASQINIETVQFQQVIANNFRKEMIAKGRYIGIVETKPRTSKDARIKAMQPMYYRRKVYHRPGMRDLEQELLSYPNGAHDDILDALHMADSISHAADSAETIKRSRDKNYYDNMDEGQSWLVL